MALLSLASPPASAADPADRYPRLNLIPWPKEVQVAEGRLTLTPDSRVVAVQAELRSLAEILSDEIAALTGLRLKVVTDAGRTGDVVLKVNPSVRAGEPILAVRGGQRVRTRDGAYVLTVSDRAVVEGFDYRAVAEGSATILQAVGQSGGRVSLPKLTIRDWPHADYCGQLVDVARQDHPVAWLRKMVEVCRFYKVRYLHLHLTDDQGWTFPSTKYPALGSKNYGAHGGKAPRVYTLDELKGLVAYADARGVTLVPELELPGHSGAALRSLPEVFDAINPATGQPVGMGCVNMASEALYPALDTIIGEMCAVFRSSPYFHIGSDEVSMGRVALHSGYQAFMERHRLHDDGALASYFIGRVNEMVRKRGKAAIKWEGLANEASRDIIVMTWDKNSDAAGRLIAQGYTTITCPWDLGVPWEEWNMYVCNGSRLKKGDAVLGATSVAWEQAPAVHLAGVRNVASRQERTWGPDNAVTVPGFAARFQPLDAAVGKLVGVPVQPRTAATFIAPAGTCDLLAPVFAFDGNDATFYQSDGAPSAGDHFTVLLKEPRLVHAVEVHTGINHRGLLDGGEVQVSADGVTFRTVATLAGGSASATLKGKRVRAVRLLVRSDQAEPLVVRELELRLMVEVSGSVKDPAAAVGEGHLAVLKADTSFTHPMDGCAVPVINRGFTLTLDGSGSPCTYSGPITGTGRVEVRGGARGGTAEAAGVVLSGKAANTMQGTWLVRSGRLVLAKDASVQALRGTVVVGGHGEPACLAWGNNDQVEDAASIRLLDPAGGGACLELNGFRDTVGSLALDAGSRVLTDGAAGSGVLRVGKLVVAGKSMSAGVYTSSADWVRGRGYVVVGAVKDVSVSGLVSHPNESIGAGNIGVLRAASTVRLPAGECAIPFDIGAFPLTLATDGSPARYSGFITGSGPLRIEAGAGRAARQPLEIGGASVNSYRGPTLLVRGVLKLGKPRGVVTIPGDLTLGGSSPENDGDGVIWAADGQLSPSSVVTLAGTRPSFLDLDGHHVTAARILLSKAGTIRTGRGGSLQVRQLHVDGRRLKDGTYRAPQPWLEGTGTVIVDARVDVQGRVGDCAAQVGAGNVANLVGDTAFCYPVADCDLDILTNGHTVTFDSGDGNPLCYRGSIAGTGNVVLLMGPSRTGFKDAPLRLAGPRPNTTTGTFYARKGRVQLEKPDGVDAISGDVVVGGQGFNDCLFWLHSNQIKDTAHITLLSAGNDGAAYLHLNGCTEAVEALTMTAGNVIQTDGPGGAHGVLTVRSLMIDGVRKPAGIYTAATEKWIQGQGKVVVRP
ncbi:MAG TPA: family 20 glycosylhydrolase [Gemmataceae bacterium]|nr:family 20 glycosylhydrolase [Gemmataceae bacterium]